jgi:hypothetical protein
MEQTGLQLEALSNGCGPEDVDHALAHALSNTYAVAFLKKTLENDASADAWLSGSGSLPEGVAELERK